MEEQDYCAYDLEYEDVLCSAVDWETYTFVLHFRGKKYVYKQQGYISCSADTDHIRCVILEFKASLANELLNKI